MIIQGDALTELRKMASDSVDSVVTDPPAGISFMGKEWDKSAGFVEMMREVMSECLRVMKPGAHGLVWAIPRTSHWTATACEAVGFEIRDVITHLFGQGFPKSLDVSKAIDKAAAAEREVVGHQQYSAPDIRGNSYDREHVGERERLGVAITSPSTDAAKQWQGWGTALKPASEHWILIRKPLGEKTVAANVLKWCVGGLNIDASRIGTGGHHGGQTPAGKSSSYGEGKSFAAEEYVSQPNKVYAQGRFPANLVLSHNEDCEEMGTKEVGAGKFKAPNARPRNNGLGLGSEVIRSGTSGAPDNYGTETVTAWQCTEGCAVAELDRQSGVSKSVANRRNNKPSKNIAMQGDNLGHTSFGHADSGGASRFFYCAKASKSDKNAGCEGLPIAQVHRFGEGIGEGLHPEAPAVEKNFHPTVKSTKLMSYLIRLVTPPGGLVLDPFMGSGSTGVAAVTNGFEFIGIEREAEYTQIAEKRIYHALPEHKKDLWKAT